MMSELNIFRVLPRSGYNIVAPGFNPGFGMVIDQPSAIANRKMVFDCFGRKEHMDNKK